MLRQALYTDRSAARNRGCPLCVDSA